MNRILFTISLFFSTTLFGQTLEGFMGIKFGTSIEAVKKSMLSKPGCKIDLKYNDTNRIIFDGVTFAGRETLFIKMLFVDKKLHTAIAYFRPSLESKTIELFNEIKNDINEKYYKTTDDFELYEKPYYKNDGFTEQGIRLGKTTFSVYWTFKHPNTQNNVNDYISLKITESLSIALKYEDGVLVEIASSKEKAKSNSDY